MSLKSKISVNNWNKGTVCYQLKFRENMRDHNYLFFLNFSEPLYLGFSHENVTFASIKNKTKKKLKTHTHKHKLDSQSFFLTSQ